MLVGFTGLITLTGLYFGSIEVKDYRSIFAGVIVLLLLCLYYSSNVITVSEEGIETYGLFQNKKFLKWTEIKTTGIAEIRSGKIKVLDKARERNTDPLRVFLSAENSAEITPDFVFRNNHTIYLPYRKDVYELIKQQLTNDSKGV